MYKRQLSLNTSESGAANELFVRFNAVPDAAHYDAAFDAPLQPNQVALIPTTKAGDY